MTLRQKLSIRNSYDWALMFVVILLVSIGLIMLSSAAKLPDNINNGFDFLSSTILGKQIMWVIICIACFLLIQLLNMNFWRAASYIIYVISIVLLILVIFVGKEINGARSWFQLGPLTFQPSEIAKLGTALALSSYLSSPFGKFKSMSSILIPAGMIFLPVLLVLGQPDAGSALVFMSFFIALFLADYPVFPLMIVVGSAIILLLALYTDIHIVFAIILMATLLLTFLGFDNNKMWLLAFLLLIAVVFIAIYQGAIIPVLLVLAGLVVVFLSIITYLGKINEAIGTIILVGYGFLLAYGAQYSFNNILRPHQQDRINVWLHPEKCDPHGNLYNLMQSKMAISFGGVVGQGYKEGKFTKLNYVPERTTDFIFCTIGEEQGFLGTLALILIYGLLLLLIFRLAERQKVHYTRYFAYCIAGILFLHIFINIGMTMGVAPIIGIPLPFISKGGSSLLGFTLLLGILLRLDRENIA